MQDRLYANKKSVEIVQEYRTTIASKTTASI